MRLLVADLTAGIPRDVIISAQQLWLPNLATEMGKRPVTSDQDQNGWTTMTTEPTSAISAPPEEPSGQDARQEPQTLSPRASGSGAAGIAKRDPPPCIVSVLGQCLMFKGADDPAEAGQPEGVAGKSDNANAKPDGRKETPSAGDLPAVMRAGVKGSGGGLLKRWPEKLIPPTPSQMPARKRSPPTNTFKLRGWTKQTICSSRRKKSFARSKLMTRTPRNQPSLTAAYLRMPPPKRTPMRQPTPRRLQVPSRLSLEQV